MHQWRPLLRDSTVYLYLIIILYCIFLVLGLLLGYILILLIVIVFLVRRSLISENGFLARLFKRRPKDSLHRKRNIKKASHFRLSEPNSLPYSYEVVKAQLPYPGDEKFYTEMSRSHMHQHKQLWSSAATTPPIQERRNLPTVSI